MPVMWPQLVQAVHEFPCHKVMMIVHQLSQQGTFQNDIVVV